MLKVGIVKIPSNENEAELENIISELYEDRRKSLAKIKNEKSRREGAFAGLVLQRMLGELGYKKEDIIIVKNEHGKPYINSIENPPVYFNLSHSHGYVACAVSDNEVGIDIEAIREFNIKIAERCFHKKEYEYLKQFSGKEQEEKFCRIWTMKESYLKFTGQGISIPLASFCVSPPDLRIEEVTDEARCLYWNKVSFLTPEAPAGYLISLCKWQVKKP